LAASAPHGRTEGGSRRSGCAGRGRAAGDEHFDTFAGFAASVAQGCAERAAAAAADVWAVTSDQYLWRGCWLCRFGGAWLR
jgi:hypothetical protein